MNHGAASNGLTATTSPGPTVTIQMCMSHVRHILAPAMMAAVTNARASGDYHPGSGQWNTLTSGILAHAVGIQRQLLVYSGRTRHPLRHARGTPDAAVHRTHLHERTCSAE